MTTLIILILVLATLLILLAVSFGRREPDPITVDVVRGGNGRSHHYYTYEEER